MSDLKTFAVPELIAPAGDWECARAAVENGADALYFGLEQHNARMRAANFTLAELPRLMEYLHLRGVRGYVTFNTLVFPDEMSEAELWLRSIISAGADAAIIQDPGICRLIRHISPDFPMHASTQMTITSAAGVEIARELGCRQAILARECSVKDIDAIHREVLGDKLASGRKLRLEVFIHGALCVAYSGQCLTSESLGGRSANRGVCAQVCRMPYDLVVDGQVVPLDGRRYLLSPRDLAGLELLPDLILAGVDALKIEGRLKSSEYVANITAIYRAALDMIAASTESSDGGSDDSEDRALEPRIEKCRAPIRALAEKFRYDMEMAFSRGLSTGWLGGINHQELVHARFGKKRGAFLGEVIRVSHNGIWVGLQTPLKPGDGVVFDAGQPDEPEEGGRVYAVIPEGETSRLEFGRQTVDFRRVQAGAKVWKTSDPELDRRLQKSFSGTQPRFRRPIHMTISGQPGMPLLLEVRDPGGLTIRIESSVPLEFAARQPLDDKRLQEQLGRLGGTPFRLGELVNHLEGECMLPLSELNQMRRHAVEMLCEARKQTPRWTQLMPAQPDSPSEPNETFPEESSLIDLSVLVRNMPQLEAALSQEVGTILCEFEDPKLYREAVLLFRSKTGEIPGAHPRETGKDEPQAATLWVAPPRIFRTGEDWILRLVRSCNADGYLVRNYDHLTYFAGCRVAGDYTFNIANALSAEYFMRRYGLEWVTASYDLNVSQLEALVRSAPASWFEVTIHQHMPMFHMEHCLFCAFLSQGTDYTNCGRPCDTRSVLLRDRTGASHVVKADAGCRNTVFNARAQTGAEAVERLQHLGVRRFRLEFLNESPEWVARTITSYRRLLRHEISSVQVWKELKLISQIGVTRGSFE